MITAIYIQMKRVKRSVAWRCCLHINQAILQVLSKVGLRLRAVKVTSLDFAKDWSVA